MNKAIALNSDSSNSSGTQTPYSAGVGNQILSARRLTDLLCRIIISALNLTKAEPYYELEAETGKNERKHRCNDYYCERC